MQTLEARPTRENIIEKIVRIKIMLHFKMKQKDIAEQMDVGVQYISNIAHERNHKDVKVDWYFYTAHHTPNSALPAAGTLKKHDRFAAGPCVACGKLLIDGIGDPLTYLVAEDKFLCKNDECERAYAANEDSESEVTK